MNEKPSFWEEHYKKCGDIWAGSINSLPELPPGSLVLEAGCGNGKTISAMGARGWNIYGFDFSKTALKLCKKNTLKNTSAEVFVSDASDLPFKKNTFDAVLARHITGHSKEKKRYDIAAELTRVLKTGGILFFSEFERSDMRFGTGEETEPGTFLKKNGIMTHFFSEDETKELFSGMSPVYIRTDKWPMLIRGKKYPRAEVNAVFEKKIF
ncbi:MAG: methyltransferase domain-containing protein [Methanomicrobiaceae archaeon]|nr:methyltransferase domain-containing protein [Methanomicrobiaceae archaeon]